MRDRRRAASDTPLADGVALPAATSPRRLALADLISVGTVGLRTRRLRAALAALGIVIAIATVVVVTAIPASSQAALDARLTALGTDLLRADAAGSGDRPVTFPVASEGMLRRIGAVTRAATAENLHLGVKRVDREQYPDSSITALAVTGPLLRVVRGRVADGVWLGGGALPQVVLGSHAAERLGIVSLPDRPVTITIGETRFQVVGVLRPTPLSVDLESSVLVTSAAAERFLGSSGRPTVAYVTADESLLEELRPIIAATLSPEAAGRVTVSRPSAALSAKRETTKAFDGLFLGLAAVALLIGGIGIANTMFVSVLERRREIGLRRALGAHRGQIRAQFLVESVVLSGIGGLGGLVCGTAAGALWAAGNGWPLVVPTTTVALAAGASLVTGVLAGLAPAIRAARQSPTAALSSE